MKFTLIALFAAVTQLVSVSVQAETLAQAMEKCRSVSNSVKRLVCYDQLAQRANNLEDSELAEFYANRPVVVASPDARRNAVNNEVQTAPQNSFGLEQQLAERKSAEASELRSVVGKIEKNPHGKLIITLQDGQVWRQTDSERMSLSVGDSIVISRGLLGAFYLSKQGNNQNIRVKRKS
ncbi:hypothetical protein [Planctobacterium marinum]|uniref:Type IV pilus biogenesis protein PilP n=1 Tax=Planctobacterium marinum TaxID=1631968 RepID=A0AA48HZ82_9ALTE|nr:hypothetical protein MACH26_40840 [Planctobacterium marinum]